MKVMRQAVRVRINLSVQSPKVFSFPRAALIVMHKSKGERNYKHSNLIVGWISEVHPPSSAIGGCTSLIHPTSYINKWYFSHFRIPKRNTSFRHTLPLGARGDCRNPGSRDGLGLPSLALDTRIHAGMTVICVFVYNDERSAWERDMEA
jgi:hypothetical protein